MYAIPVEEEALDASQFDALRFEAFRLNCESESELWPSDEHRLNCEAELARRRGQDPWVDCEAEIEWTQNRELIFALFQYQEELEAFHHDALIALELFRIEEDRRKEKEGSLSKDKEPHDDRVLRVPAKPARYSSFFDRLARWFRRLSKIQQAEVPNLLKETGQKNRNISQA